MKFSTKVPIVPTPHLIDYHSRITTLGSCFADNMGEKLDYFKFQNTLNPFGIIFNPDSIAQLVTRAVTKRYFTAQDIFFHHDLWHCYQVHSQWSHPDRETFLSLLNEQLELTYTSIIESTHCIITYGTAWVYTAKESGAIVANCHKVPQNQFDKTILSVNAIQNAIQETINTIRSVNPECHFIFTVSPVRHLKDGFVENQRSKAHLITALHEVLATSERVAYFPSYEILMDELRDYRFYAEDMLHPSAVAIDYIWDCFCENSIDSNCFSVMREVDSIQKSLEHRPFNPDTEQHQKFVASLNQKIIRLQEQFPRFQF
ncbi:GSCFA domain-containing protein [Flavobacterium sp. XGLA_31]|uniref:GSCFA domain-containing protein n=1 Tax=Flavobacterium sp. XGLA_31 TaxID=3447666 RepID=UPI003F2DDA69